MLIKTETMKIPKLLVLFGLAAFLMAGKCVNDADENNTSDEDFKEIRYGKDETVTKAMAIEDWEMFLKQSQSAIDVVEANIGNLQIRIDEADHYEKQQWQQVCDYCNLHLLQLKSKRLARNKQFESEIDRYNASTYEKNEAFETEFSNEMAHIDSKLETVFERMRSGYYKTQNP